MFNPHHFLRGGKILQHHLSSLIRLEECIYLIRRYSSRRIAAKDLKTLHLGKHKSYSQLQSLFSPLIQWCSCRCILKPKQKSDPTNVKILSQIQVAMTCCVPELWLTAVDVKKRVKTQITTQVRILVTWSSVFVLSKYGSMPLKKEKAFILWGK